MPVQSLLVTVHSQFAEL